MKVDGRVLAIASQLEHGLMAQERLGSSNGAVSGSCTLHVALCYVLNQANLGCCGLITPGSDRELVVQ